MLTPILLAAYATFSSPTISNNGSTMGWLRTQGQSTQARLVGTFSPELTHAIGTGSISALAVSPSGTRAAFLSDRDTPGQDQLFITGEDGRARRITSGDADRTSPQWSPDGRAVSLLVIDQAQAAPGPLSARQRPSGVVGEGRHDIQQLIVFDVATGRIRYASPRTQNIYEAVWSPKGDRLAVIAASGPGDFDNWYVATLNVIDVASGREGTVVKSPLQLAQPAWIDDTTIAYIGGLMSDVVSPGGNVYVVDTASDVTREVLSDPGSGSATHLWRCGSHRLCLRLYIGDTTALAYYDTSSHAFRVVRNEPENITSYTTDSRGDFLIASEAFEHPMALFLVTSKSARRLDFQPAESRTWGHASNVCWQSGVRYCGWLLWPRQARSTKPPLLVYVHGGPGYNTPPFWPHQWPTDVLRDELARGVAIFFPNYRGSFGFGERGTQAIRGSVGRGDVADVLAGVERVVAQEPVDTRRVAIYGNSFGGSITLAAIGQSHRFVAAVAGEAVTDWYSYSGQNGIESEVPFFLKPYYRDPMAYLLGSPIYYVGAVTTPALLLQGDADQEVPTMQPYEFWRALKARGVPTRFRIFHNEGHAYSGAADKQQFSSEAEAWLDTYLR